MSNKGWECPKCGRVFAPDVKECEYCNGAVGQLSPYTFGGYYCGTCGQWVPYGQFWHLCMAQYEWPYIGITGGRWPAETIQYSDHGWSDCLITTASTSPDDEYLVVDGSQFPMLDVVRIYGGS